MNTLYYLGKPEDGFGWGVANTNLVAALSKLCNVVVDTSPRTKFDAPVFVPVINSSLRPLRKSEAPRVLGYCFTEWPIEDGAHREARKYDILFAGSTWNCERLIAAGIKHCEPLLQGIDHSIFKPQPPSEREGFVVFSGGKYEFRKGQDIVLAAMAQFMKQRADAVLLAAWHNPWPQSVESMNNSWLIDPKEPWKHLPEDRCVLLPPVPNANTPQLYAQAHIGVFPNRCEAGTNLVMCEFMACERPVIASFAHGHRDVINPTHWGPEPCEAIHTGPPCKPGPYLLRNGSTDFAGWFNPPVSDLITHLEHAYTHREELQERARECRRLTEKLTWEACADKIYKAAFGV